MKITKRQGLGEAHEKAIELNCEYDCMNGEWYTFEREEDDPPKDVFYAFVLGYMYAKENK